MIIYVAEFFFCFLFAKNPNFAKIFCKKYKAKNMAAIIRVRQIKKVFLIYNIIDNPRHTCLVWRFVVKQRF